MNLKQRDGEVDSVLLILRDTRATRDFLRDASDELAGAFPVQGSRPLELLRAGVRPPGNATVLIPRSTGQRGPLPGT